MVESLRRCDRALSACDRAIQSGLDTRRQQQELLTQQEKELEKLRQPSSVVTSPLLWIIIGGTLGVIASPVAAAVGIGAATVTSIMRR